MQLADANAKVLTSFHFLSLWASSFKLLVLILWISQAKFGVTITQDTCLHKVLFNSILRLVRFSHSDLLFSDQDYTQQCPVGWVPNVEGWCKPPKTYTVTFRHQKATHGVSAHDGAHVLCRVRAGGKTFLASANSGMSIAIQLQRFVSTKQVFHFHLATILRFALQVYKLLWSERCGATWPCIEHIGHQCMLELNYLEHGKWRHSACKVCHQRLLSCKHFNTRKSSSLSHAGWRGL